jgi:hypothetical protein
MRVEVLRRIADDLSPTDRVASAKADPGVVVLQIRAEAHAAIATEQASNVRSLSAFKALLGSIVSLPESLRSEPLYTLGAQLLRLPAEAQRPAIEAFLASLGTPAGPGAGALVEQLARLAAIHAVRHCADVEWVIDRSNIHDFVPTDELRRVAAGVQ